VRAFLLVILLSLILVGTACATTHYVSWSGNNTPPYTSWETATPLISFAELSSTEGDTIFIDSGQYHLIMSISLKPKVTLRGKGMDSTVVYGSSQIPRMISVNDSTIVEDIYFIGSGSYEAIDNLFRPHLTHTVLDCRFSNLSSSAVILDFSSSVTIRNCSFDTWNDAALELTTHGNHLVENCTFYKPDGWGYVANLIFNQGEFIFRHNIVVGTLDALDGLGSYGSWVIESNLFYESRSLEWVIGTDANELTVQNNSLYITRDLGLPTYFVDNGNSTSVYGPRKCWIVNNAVWALRPRVTFWGGLSPEDEIEISYNCFYSVVPWQEYLGTQYHDSAFKQLDPEATPQVTWVGNIFSDPMYVDPDGGDLHLQYGSPCIDAGDPDVFDLDGTRCDIGAFGGPDGEFYIYQDLPPKAPAKFTAVEQGNTIELSWKGNSESDLYQYVLFRSESAGVPIDSEHVVAYIAADSASKTGLAACGGPSLDSGFRRNDLNKQSGRNGERQMSTSAPECDSGYICFTDSTVLSQHSYFYTVIAMDKSSLASDPAEEVGFMFTDVVDNQDQTLPENVSLEQNYPNPFNARTAIVYHLPNIGAQPAPVKLTIYNVLGHLVKTLVNERQQPGEHTAYWDGLNESGQTVSSGVYFYTLNVSGLDFARSRKMVLLK
jgi:hypothetical protein